MFLSAALGSGTPLGYTIFFEMGGEGRASMGNSDGTIRISVGIEDQDELLADFGQALN